MFGNVSLSICFLPRTETKLVQNMWDDEKGSNWIIVDFERAVLHAKDVWKDRHPDATITFFRPWPKLPLGPKHLEALAKNEAAQAVKQEEAVEPASASAVKDEGAKAEEPASASAVKDEGAKAEEPSTPAPALTLPPGLENMSPAQKKAGTDMV